MQYAERLKQEESRLVRIAHEEQVRREQRDLEMQVLSVIKKVLNAWIISPFFNSPLGIFIPLLLGGSSV